MPFDLERCKRERNKAASDVVGGALVIAVCVYGAATSRDSWFFVIVALVCAMILVNGLKLLWWWNLRIKIEQARQEQK